MTTTGYPLPNNSKQWIILWVLLLPFILYPSPFDTGELPYIITSWSTEDGLPQNSIQCILQTHDGYIWIGTPNGLVRFDSIDFRVFNRWNTPNLKNDSIQCLYQDNHGTLWIGTDGGGLMRLVDSTMSTYTFHQGLTSNTILTLTGDPSGNLWIGTNNGLNRMKDGKILAFTDTRKLNGNIISALCYSKSKVLWIGDSSGQLHILRIPTPGKPPSIASIPTAPTIDSAITSLHEDTRGTLWIGTERGLFNLEPPGSIANSPTPITAYLPGKSIRTMTADSDANLWIGTDGDGLYRKPKNSTSFIRLPAGEGLPDDFIYSLMLDREGNLWAGTFTAGLLRFKKSKIRTITYADGLPDEKITAIIQDHANFIWAGTYRKGLCKIDPNTLKVTRIFSTSDGLSSNKITALSPGQNNILWIGTSAGLNRLNLSPPSPKIDSYSPPHPLPSKDITAIYHDRSGTLRIGTDKGLYFENQSIPGLPAAPINFISEDSRGRIIIGTPNGLFFLQDRRFQKYTALIDENILTFYENKSGEMFIGTSGRGLARFKPGIKNSALIPFSTLNGAPDNYIFSISEDPSGNLWMSSFKGIFRISPDFSSLAFFDEEEGMKSRECTSRYRPPAFISPGGILYVSTTKGIAIIDTMSPQLLRNPIPPSVFIENIIADNRSLINSPSTTLTHSVHLVEFYFSALSFTSPGKALIRYKLDGFDKQWQEVSHQQKRMAFYVNLPYGDYCFHVIARNPEGTWNREGARFKFHIEAPLFQRPAFYFFLAVILGSLGAITLWFFIKLKNKKKQTGDEPTIENEKETVETKEKYKTSALLPETIDQVLPRLTRLMEKEKVYLEPDLNLKKLSERIHIHYNHLSQIINERIGKSFNDYINYYRIEEAKKRLSNPAEDHKTVLEIAYDTGFYSKSVFNTAFKKFTGMTPSDFRKKKKS